MTNSKMIKILSSYEDVVLFEIKDVDKYDFDLDEFTCPVREVILLSDIIGEFENKSGDFYNEFHFGDKFNDLIKLIESGKSGGYRYKNYEDSYNEFKTKWNELHPDESYYEHEKKVKEKKRREEARAWNELVDVFGNPYIFHNYYRSVYDPFMVGMTNPKSKKYHR